MDMGQGTTQGARAPKEATHVERMTPDEYRAHCEGRKKPSKYRNKHARYRGRTFDSRAEARYCRLLDERGATYIVQPIVPLPDWDAVVYRPDFLVLGDDPHFVDVKGYETKAFRQIKKLWKKWGPGPLHVVSASNLVATCRVPPGMCEGEEGEG